MRQLLALVALLLSATAASAYRENVDGWEVFDFDAKDMNVVGCMAARPNQGGDAAQLRHFDHVQLGSRLRKPNLAAPKRRNNRYRRVC
jgi:hypothetical protein